MFCPKCGAENPDTNQKCENCSFVFAPEEPAESVQTATMSKEIVSEPAKNPETPSVSEVSEILKNMGFAVPEVKLKKASLNKKMAVFLWIAAAVVLVLALCAAGMILTGASSIAQIRTFTGNTLEEAYYRELNTVYQGYAVMLATSGVFMASILTFFGFRSFAEDKE